MSITSETCRESYNSLLPELKTRRDFILQILTECGDMTAQEIADELHGRGITPAAERNFAAPRLTELQKLGFIQAAGKRICCKTGKNVTVWSAGKDTLHINEGK
ncbi:MAG: DNA gyrase [Eubacterium sp.]|jgi:predicted ArsR family transcriptional regulator|nr:DNA gyrase [Eubacterium sp.]